MKTIAWDEPATLIDLDGKVPVIATIRECVLHYTLFKPHAKAQARILLSRAVFREGQRTRTWLLDPAEIELLAARLEGEGQTLN
ncbi:MAG: hypothetical protein KGL54_09570 [Sphingomonadales bacterium]|nr:hypothetical protein [Sphingomonadales bacterium]